MGVEWETKWILLDASPTPQISGESSVPANS